VFRALNASSSLKSKLNRAIAEASEDRDLVEDPSVEIELDPATVGVGCKVHAVSSNLGSAILIVDERQKRLISDLLRRQLLDNKSSPQMWPLVTLAGQLSNRSCRRSMKADANEVCERRRKSLMNNDQRYRR